MRKAETVLAAKLLFSALAAFAFFATTESPQASESALMIDAASVRGQRIELRGLRCVDDNRRFLCLKVIGKIVIRLEGASLGAATPQRVAEALAGPCKGSANLDRARCTMRAAGLVADTQTRVLPSPQGELFQITATLPIIDMQR